MTTANETSEGDIVSALVGLDEPRAGHPLRDRGALIRIRDATRRISPTFEIEIPSIDIVPGEITAVVGANGAGKTTLLRVVAGLLAIDRGTWLHRFRNDDDPGGLRLGDFELPDFVAIRDAIHVVPSPHMYQMTVRLDLVTTAVASGYRGPKARARALTWLHRMGLAPYAEQLYRTLSDGYRVRADIARAMVRKPQVLVLDEPLGPLDVLAQEKILADLRDIADSCTWPMPVVVSSQHLSEIESIADNVIFVRGGCVVFSGPVRDLPEVLGHGAFEVRCSLDSNRLASAVEGIGSVRTGHRTLGAVIRTPRGTKPDVVLRAILDAGGVVEEFRDISRSSRMLFEGEDK